MVWTDSQDYGADEILYTTWIVLFDKINRLIREIIILFEVYPQLFQFLILKHFIATSIKRLYPAYGSDQKRGQSILVITKNE